jgi:hypothetical protein
MSASDGPRFGHSNVSVERTVRFRYVTFYVTVVTIVGSLGGFAVLHATRGYPVVPMGGELLAVPIVFALALALSWVAARGVIMLLVPRAIAIEDQKILGDFRRKGWKGPPTREIRFENIKSFGRETTLRIGLVRARPDRTLRDPLDSSTCFYLSDSNLAAVRTAFEARRGGH